MSACDFIFQYLWVASFSGPGHMCSIPGEWKEKVWGLRETTIKDQETGIATVLLGNSDSVIIASLNFFKEQREF